MLQSLHGITPQIGRGTFIAETAAVIGDVVIGEESSVWYSAVIRGDVNRIRIGDRVSIQDCSCLHCSEDDAWIEIGNDVTVGHNVCLHGCKIEDNVLIGMGSTVLDNVHVCSGSVVAAGALVLGGTQIGPGELWGGVPARLIKHLDQDAIDRIVTPLPKHYQYWAKEYLDATKMILCLLVSTFTMTSCNEYSPFVLGPMERVYQEDFVQSFGAIDPQHNWGFDDQYAMGQSASTRAAATVDESRRIMCEDLAFCDHDFNDLVFDVSFYDDNNDGQATAYITLQAAGGTLPIYIGKREDAYEAHHLFGVATNTPVNVKTNGVNKAPVSFEYPETIQGTKSGTTWMFNPRDIKIFVSSTVDEVTLLANEIGGAPQKFACLPSVKWANELTDISRAYTDFASWVSDQQATYWQKGNKVDANIFTMQYMIPLSIPVVTSNGNMNVDDSTK